MRAEDFIHIKGTIVRIYNSRIYVLYSVGNSEPVIRNSENRIMVYFTEIKPRRHEIGLWGFREVFNEQHYGVEGA